MPALPSSWKSRLPGLATLLVSAVLLFAQLGHYSLWDDEALTALVALGINQTGDTSVVVDHNVVAFRSGLLVKDLCDRSTPPLCEYLTAPFLLAFPGSALAARFPFALLGWLTILIGVVAMQRSRVPAFSQWLAFMAIIGNVSLFLYFRQCRYYSPMVFFSTLIVVLYLSWKQVSTRRLLLLSFLSVLLFASNYLGYLLAYACLAIDWLLWRRRELRLGLRDLAVLFVPQGLLCGLLALVWNPLSVSYGAYLGKNTPWDRIVMFLWSWRDLNHCEFFGGVLLAAAVIAGLVWRDKWIIRGAIAAVIYTAALAVVTPQIRSTTTVADVRYAVALIPLFIAIEVRFLSLLPGKYRIPVFLLALVAFGTNLLNGGPLLARQFHSTIADYVGELRNPPPEPYAPVIQWIKNHVTPGQSVLVYPDYMVYTLMFHAPQAVYAWQLDERTPPSLRKFPDIHFRLREAPDYLVGFGPATGQMIEDLKQLNRPVRYEIADQLNVLGIPLFRPELFWRTFKPIPQFDPRSHGIYLFRRVSPPLTDSSPPPQNPNH